MRSQKEIVLALRQIEGQMGTLQQKNQVQNVHIQKIIQKRIKYLKKENQQLKQKQKQNSQTSQQILNQNAQLKKRNRQLKVRNKNMIQNRLQQLKKMMQLTQNSNKGPQTITIKDLVITHKTQQIDLVKSQLTCQDIQGLKYFTNVKSIMFSDNFISDIGANLICQNLSKIRKLFLNDNKITAQGIKNIHKLTNLRCLDLRVNQIKDQGLQYIIKLPQLTQLSISSNKITDEGLQNIQKLTNLHYLDLTSNSISNKGGLQILKLKQLANLYLSHNKIQSIVCGKLISQLKEVKVLDLRFNDISKQDKLELKGKYQGKRQLFL